MAQIIFYEKPGCINNTRQKRLLRQAGHTVIEKSLLIENWTENPLALREFFGDKPVSEWFNRSAPDIKKGVINPELLGEQQAIDLMLVDPLLIRRPLMQVGREKKSGFNEQEVKLWVGLSGEASNADLENCPQNSTIELWP